jgi:hypothetical protein
MSRVLMSLNDYDVPISYLDIEKEPSIFMKIMAATVGLIIFLSLVLVILLPEILGDSVLEAGVTMVVNGVIGIAHSMSVVGTIALPVSFGILILGGVGYMEFQHYQFLTGSRWSLQKPVPVVKIEDEVDAASLDLTALAELDKKMARIKPSNWRLAVRSRMEAAEADGNARAQGQKTLLDSVRSATGFRSKALPTMASLVSKGILPDIFSPERVAADRDGTSSLVRVSQVHRKYLRKSKVAPKSPMDSVRDMERMWLSKSVAHKSGEDHEPAGLYSKKEKQGVDELAQQVVLASRKKKGAQQVTSELLSLFGRGDGHGTTGGGGEGGGDDSELDADAAQQLKMDMRRKRRERRQKQGGKGGTTGSLKDAGATNGLSVDVDDTDDYYENTGDESSTGGSPKARAGMPSLNLGAVNSPANGGKPVLPPAQPVGAPPARMSVQALNALATTPISLKGGNDSDTGVASGDAGGGSRVSRKFGNRFNLQGKGSDYAASGEGEGEGEGDVKGSKSKTSNRGASQLADLFSSANDTGKDPFGFSALHDSFGDSSSTAAAGGGGAGGSSKRKHHRRKIKTKSVASASGAESSEGA